MDKSVRFIFKVLIGTVVLIVVSSLVIEMLNISLFGIQLQQNIKLACNKALTLFSQETYKKRDGSGQLHMGVVPGIGGSVNMKDVKNCDGGTYIPGIFYDGDSVESIYNSLYSKATNPKFADWMETPEIKDKWANLSMLNRYLNDRNSFLTTEMPKPEDYVYEGCPDINAGYEAYEAKVAEYTEYATAKSFVDNYMTPLNFGVPYVDTNTLQKMFRWNVAQLLSNYDPNAIVRDDNGEYCIQKNGFRIYADRAVIQDDDIEYKVFDVSKSDDKDDFIDLTNINPNDLGFADNGTIVEEAMGTSTDERTKICVIGVKFRVPISYVGITPIKNIFESVWTNEVQGLRDSAPNLPDQHFSTATAELEGGGMYGDAGTPDAGVLPVPGKLIFYLIR